MEESGLCFDCGADSLVGVLSMAATPSDIGVVIAVGGPQYRAGSHRQFVLLARRLAAHGYCALRFDARGMGDSGGDFPGFEALGPDLAAARAAMQVALPGVRRVVLWGLCDAASAALLTASVAPSWAGLVLLNPWVRHVDTHARTEVRHYYARRALDPAFWRKLLAGKVSVVASAVEFAGKAWRVWQARGRVPGGADTVPDFRERMAQGALAFAGPQLYVLSGRDHVCAEFLDFAADSPRWQAVWSRADVLRHKLPSADHTFSNHEARVAVEDATLAFLDRLTESGR